MSESGSDIEQDSYIDLIDGSDFDFSKQNHRYKNAIESQKFPDASDIASLILEAPCFKGMYLSSVARKEKLSNKDDQKKRYIYYRFFKKLSESKDRPKLLETFAKIEEDLKRLPITAKGSTNNFISKIKESYETITLDCSDERKIVESLLYQMLSDNKFDKIPANRNKIKKRIAIKSCLRLIKAAVEDFRTDFSERFTNSQAFLDKVEEVGLKKTRESLDKFNVKRHYAQAILEEQRRLYKESGKIPKALTAPFVGDVVQYTGIPTEVKYKKRGEVKSLSRIQVEMLKGAVELLQDNDCDQQKDFVAPPGYGKTYIVKLFPALCEYFGVEKPLSLDLTSSDDLIKSVFFPEEGMKKLPKSRLLVIDEMFYMAKMRPIFQNKYHESLGSPDKVVAEEFDIGLHEFVEKKLQELKDSSYKIITLGASVNLSQIKQRIERRKSEGRDCKKLEEDRDIIEQTENDALETLSRCKKQWNKSEYKDVADFVADCPEYTGVKKANSHIKRLFVLPYETIEPHVRSGSTDTFMWEGSEEEVSSLSFNRDSIRRILGSKNEKKVVLFPVIKHGLSGDMKSQERAYGVARYTEDDDFELFTIDNVDEIKNYTRGYNECLCFNGASTSIGGDFGPESLDVDQSNFFIRFGKESPKEYTAAIWTQNLNRERVSKEETPRDRANRVNVFFSDNNFSTADLECQGNNDDWDYLRKQANLKKPEERRNVARFLQVILGNSERDMNIREFASLLAKSVLSDKQIKRKQHLNQSIRHGYKSLEDFHKAQGNDVSVSTPKMGHNFIGGGNVSIITSNTQLRRENDSLRQENIELRAIRDDLRAIDVTQLRGENADLKEAKEKLLKERELLKLKTRELELNIEKLGKKIEERVSEIERAARKKLSELENQLSPTQSKLKIKELELVNLKEGLRLAETKSEELKKENTKLQEQLDTVTQQNRQLESTVKELTKGNEGLAEVQAEKEGLEAENKSLLEDKQRSKVRTDSLEKENAALKDKLRALEKKIANLEVRIRAFKEKEEQDKTEIEKLETQNQSLQETQDRNKELERELGQAKAELLKLQDQQKKTVSRDDYETLQKKLTEAEKKLEKLNRDEDEIDDDDLSQASDNESQNDKEKEIQRLNLEINTLKAKLLAKTGQDTEIDELKEQNQTLQDELDRTKARLSELDKLKPSAATRKFGNLPSQTQDIINEIPDEVLQEIAGFDAGKIEEIININEGLKKRQEKIAQQEREIQDKLEEITQREEELELEKQNFNASSQKRKQGLKEKENKIAQQEIKNEKERIRLEGERRKLERERKKFKNSTQSTSFDPKESDLEERDQELKDQERKNAKEKARLKAEREQLGREKEEFAKIRDVNLEKIAQNERDSWQKRRGLELEITELKAENEALSDQDQILQNRVTELEEAMAKLRGALNARNHIESSMPQRPAYGFQGGFAPGLTPPPSPPPSYPPYFEAYPSYGYGMAPPQPQFGYGGTYPAPQMSYQAPPQQQWPQWPAQWAVQQQTPVVTQQQTNNSSAKQEREANIKRQEEQESKKQQEVESKEQRFEKIRRKAKEREERIQKNEEKIKKLTEGPLSDEQRGKFDKALAATAERVFGKHTSEYNDNTRLATMKAVSSALMRFFKGQEPTTLGKKALQIFLQTVCEAKSGTDLIEHCKNNNTLVGFDKFIEQELARSVFSNPELAKEKNLPPKVLRYIEEVDLLNKSSEVARDEFGGGKA